MKYISIVNLLLSQSDALRTSKLAFGPLQLVISAG